ncbi:unnamed protein product, partial [Rotaria sp. Silwood2]
IHDLQLIEQQSIVLIVFVSTAVGLQLPIASDAYVSTMSLADAAVRGTVIIKDS